MAGHSAWKNIKHKKAAADARRGKVWSKCARAIMVAAKIGGADPESNLALRYAIEDARAANMPKATIENAIKKGSGELIGDNYETVMYEGYGPGGAAVLCEILTNNRNRTAGDLRMVFDKNGGKLGAAGSVAYLFTQKGVIALPQSAVTEDRLMELALEAGAEDVKAEGDQWIVTTDVPSYIAVKNALVAAKLEPSSAELTFVPSTTVQLTGDDARKMLKLMDGLDDNDDVQKAHANFEIPDAELASIEG